MARNGKDTAAAAIINAFKHQYHIRRYALADALKVEVYDAIMVGTSDPRGAALATEARDRISAAGVAGVDGALASVSTDVEKIVAINEWKSTIRATLQQWGTEYRRNRDDNYWVDLLDRRIRMEAPQYALVTDVRFRNELGWVRGRGGVGVHVKRTEYVPDATTMDHISEQELAKTEFDYVIAAPTVTELEHDIVNWFDYIAKRSRIVPSTPFVG